MNTQLQIPALSEDDGSKDPAPRTSAAQYWSVAISVVAFIAAIWYGFGQYSLRMAAIKLVQLFAIFLALGVVFWLIESLWPEDEKQSYLRHDGAVSGCLWMFNITAIARVSASFVLIGAAVITMLHLPHLSSNWISRQPKLVQLAEIAVIKDFIGYWNHRMFHEVPFLWRFHSVHHSSKEVSWLAAGRDHPFETVLTKLVTVLPMVLLGFPATVLGPYVGLWTLYLFLLHANVKWSYGPFRHLVASPAYHRWHHSSQPDALDKNYSTLLPIWDYLFHTAYFPKGVYSKQYGLYQDELPESVVGMLVEPVKRAVHVLTDPQRDETATEAIRASHRIRQEEGPEQPSLAD